MVTNNRRINNDYDDILDAAGQAHNVDPRIIKNIWSQESSGRLDVPDPKPGDPNYAAWVANDYPSGPLQITRGTAAAMGISDPHDLRQSIYGATRYYRQGLDAKGSPEGAIKFYFAGPNQQLWKEKTDQYLADVSNRHNLITVNPDAVPEQRAYNPPPLVDRNGAPVATRRTPAPQAPQASDNSDDPVAAYKKMLKEREAAAANPPATPAPVDPNNPVEQYRNMLRARELPKGDTDSPTTAETSYQPKVTTPSAPDTATLDTGAVAAPVIPPPAPVTPPTPAPVGKGDTGKEVVPVTYDMTGEGMDPAATAAITNRIQNLLTDPYTYHGAGTPLRSWSELIGRTSDALGITSNAYYDTRGGHQTADDQFRKDHPATDTSATNETLGNIGANAAILATGNTGVGALARLAGVPAAVTNFVGGAGRGLSGPVSGATGAMIYNAENNLLNSSKSDAPIGDQVLQGTGSAAVTGAALNPLLQLIPRPKSGLQLEDIKRADHMREEESRAATALNNQYQARQAAANNAISPTGGVLDANGNRININVPPYTADLDQRMMNLIANPSPPSPIGLLDKIAMEKEVKRGLEPTWQDRLRAGLQVPEIADKAKATVGAAVGGGLAGYVTAGNPYATMGGASAGAYLMNLLKFAKSPQEADAIRQTFLDALGQNQARVGANALQSSAQAARGTAYPTNNDLINATTPYTGVVPLR